MERGSNQDSDKLVKVVDTVLASPGLALYIIVIELERRTSVRIMRLEGGSCRLSGARCIGEAVLRKKALTSLPHPGNVVMLIL